MKFYAKYKCATEKSVIEYNMRIFIEIYILTPTLLNCASFLCLREVPNSRRRRRVGVCRVCADQFQFVVATAGVYAEE